MPEGSWLHRLVHEEEASAAVEFIVLIPVYVLLLTCLFMVGNLAMARQQVVAAVRFKVWSVQDPAGFANYDRAFFGPFSGQFTHNRQQRPATRFGRNQFDIQTAQLALADARERARVGRGQALRALNAARTRSEAIAVHLLNNRTRNNAGGDRPFHATTATAEFAYNGVSIMPQVRQSARAAVLLPRRHTREEYNTNQGHPAVRWGQASNYFDPVQDNYTPLSPQFPGYFDRRFGIWETRARIRGSDSSERTYYQPLPKPN